MPEAKVAGPTYVDATGQPIQVGDRCLIAGRRGVWEVYALGTFEPHPEAQIQHPRRQYASLMLDKRRTAEDLSKLRVCHRATTPNESPAARPASYGGDVYGGWHPETLTDLLECEQNPYITPASVTPAWVEEMRAAARECKAGHPAGMGGRTFCGVWGCQGVRTSTAAEEADTDG